MNIDKIVYEPEGKEGEVWVEVGKGDGGGGPSVIRSKIKINQ